MRAVLGRAVAPAVVGDQRLAVRVLATARPRRGLLEIDIAGRRALDEIDRQDEQLGRRGLALEIGVGDRALRRARQGRGRGAVAGDDAGDMRAVAGDITEDGRHGIDGEDAVGQVGMIGIDTGIVDVHQHAGTGEAKVGIGVLRHGAGTERIAALVVGEHRSQPAFDQVDTGDLGQRHQRRSGRFDGDQRAVHAAFPEHLATAERGDLRHRRVRLRHGQDQLERIDRGRGRQRQRQQAGLQLEVRFVREDRGGLRSVGQRLRGGGRRLHQEGIDRHVADDPRAGRSQPFPECLADRALGLDDVGSRFGRAERRGDRERFAAGGVHESVPEQQRVAFPDQPVGAGRRVAEPVGGLGVGELRLLAGCPRTGRDPLGDRLRGDHRNGDRGRWGGRRRRRRSRRDQALQVAAVAVPLDHPPAQDRAQQEQSESTEDVAAGRGHSWRFRRKGAADDDGRSIAREQGAVVFHHGPRLARRTVEAEERAGGGFAGDLVVGAETVVAARGGDQRVRCRLQ